MGRMSAGELGQATVWGFDGKIAGEEDGLQVVLPFLRLPNGQLVALCSLDGEVSALGDNEEWAKECGTKIETRYLSCPSCPFRYWAGTLLEVMGSRYVARLSELIEVFPTGLAEIRGSFLTPDLDTGVEIQEGFYVRLVTLAEHEQRCRLISWAARALFDRELARYLAEAISGLGNQATILLANTPDVEGGTLEAELRYLVLLRVVRRLDLFESKLTDVAVLYNIAAGDLKRAVDIRIWAARGN